MYTSEQKKKCLKSIKVALVVADMQFSEQRSKKSLVLKRFRTPRSPERVAQQAPKNSPRFQIYFSGPSDWALWWLQFEVSF